MTEKWWMSRRRKLVVFFFANGEMGYFGTNKMIAKVLLWPGKISEKSEDSISKIWRCPFRHGGTPSYHPFLDGIFPHKNHSFLGTPMAMETPICFSKVVLKMRFWYDSKSSRNFSDENIPNFLYGTGWLWSRATHFCWSCFPVTSVYHIWVPKICTSITYIQEIPKRGNAPKHPQNHNLLQ